ncbi:hypothetical protein U1Q18_008366 [Sarracenia purpurea var. burkii]
MFPPPLMRFLKSNAGSRSSGRSRSSPMFIRKKNASIETQEPSSPKVTCIGQVRVRRSSTKSRSSSSAASRTRRRSCSCLRTTQFSRRFAQKIKLKSFHSVWRKWVWFFRFGYCRRADNRDDSSKPNRQGKSSDVEDENEDEDHNEEEGRLEVESSSMAFNDSSAPLPKNAFLLTRCRSAPYRSSSLGNRFWGSPLVVSEAEDDNEEKNRGKHRRRGEDREPERPTSEIVPNCVESRENRENKGKLGGFGDFEALIEGKIKEISHQEEGTGERPLILTRCKSEPARTGERLNPDGSFWK